MSPFNNLLRTKTTEYIFYIDGEGDLDTDSDKKKYQKKGGSEI